MGSCHSTEDVDNNDDTIYYARNLKGKKLVEAENFTRSNIVYYDEKNMVLIRFIQVYQKNNIVVNKSFSQIKGKGYSVIVNADKNDTVVEIVKLL